MNTKFNSILETPEMTSRSDYYGVDTTDNILGLSKLVLNFDTRYLKENKIINERNYPERQYSLYVDGRPCSTSLCSSNKFCDSAGWPTKLKNIKEEASINSNVFTSSNVQKEKVNINPMSINSNKVI